MDTHSIALDAFDIELVLSLLDKTPFFGGLDRDQVQPLLPSLKKSQHREGDVIFRQDQLSSQIYIILRGSIRLVFELDRHPLLKGDLGVGECFGETSVVGIQTHSASAIASVDTELLQISKETLMSWFAQDKELFAQIILNIARETCRRLHHTDQLLLEQLYRQAHGVVQLPLPLSTGCSVVPQARAN